MNALAGLASLGGALYLAARTKGIGSPLEDQPSPRRTNRFSKSSDAHAEQALFFFRLAQSAIIRAKAAATADNCHQTELMLRAANEAVRKMEANTMALPSGEKRQQLEKAQEELKRAMIGIKPLHRRACVATLVQKVS